MENSENKDLRLLWWFDLATFTLTWFRPWFFAEKHRKPQIFFSGEDRKGTVLTVIKM